MYKKYSTGLNRLTVLINVSTGTLLRLADVGHRNIRLSSSEELRPRFSEQGQGVGALRSLSTLLLVQAGQVV